MCDTMVALADATAEGVALFAKNSDRPPHERQVVQHVPPKREQVTAVTHVAVQGHPEPTFAVTGSRPTWMWGMEHGVNERGVAVGNEMIFTTDDPREAPAALTGMDLVRLVLERAPDAAEGVALLTDLLERYGQGGSGHDHEDIPYWSSFLVADPTSAFVVETSARTWAVEEVTRTRAISNRTTIPAFEELHREARLGTEPFVDGRWEACTAAVGREPVTEPALREHLRSHTGGDGGWTVCMHVEGLEATTASLVTALPDPADGPIVARFLLGWPCRSVYVPLVVGQTFQAPDHELFAGLTDADRPRLDALEADLDAAVLTGEARERPDWNDEAWHRVRNAVGEALG